MGLRLGNLKINEIENYLGIKFTEEHLAILTPSRVDQVSHQRDLNYKIPKDTWHAFELPMVQFHCGSQAFAEIIKKILSSYMTDGSFPNKVRIGITNELLEEEKFGYAERQNMVENNLEIYVGRKKSDYRDTDEILFYKKVRETAAGNIFLQEVKQNRKSNSYTTWLVVPNVNEVETNNIYKEDENGYYAKDENDNYIKIGSEDVKPIRKKRTEDNTYVVKDYSSEIIITPWDGKPVQTGY